MVCGSACRERRDRGRGERGYAGMAEAGVVAGSGALTDWISLGVLASRVPRDAVDDAIAETGKGAHREVPSKVEITQPRERLGPGPLARLFSQAAQPLADLDTTGAFLGPW